MTYTAFTIGPIYKTLKSVKSTKAIWAASYLFSYLIKEIIKKIKKLNDGSAIIFPYCDKIKDGIVPLDDNFKIGAGLFPDRIILKGKIDLKIIIIKVLNDFSKELSKSIEKNSDLDKITKYIKNYINCYHLQTELDDKDNIILEIHKMLDSLELQQRVLEDANGNYLNDFLEKKKPYNFLINLEFASRPFPSTIEISSAEFSSHFRHSEKYEEARKILTDDSEKSQVKFVKELKRIVGDDYRNYQKYIAVVQADGDNMSDFIKLLYGQDDRDKLINIFSKNLLSFAIEAVNLIKDRFGTPIYAGGDDLLYFMPVARMNVEINSRISSTIFTLIKEIDIKFKELILDEPELKKVISQQDSTFKKPSMSYGVSISYHKFPLNQALEKGSNQLFQKAKSGEKDAVSYTILKHSGQFFGTTFHKSKKSYSTFMKLIEENLDKSKFISSIIHKLEVQSAVLKGIGTVPDVAKRELMFHNFLFNNFNERIHRSPNDKNKLSDFLENVKQFFKDVYNENPIKGTPGVIEVNNNINIEKVYSALRFIEFIHNKEDRDDKEDSDE